MLNKACPIIWKVAIYTEFRQFGKGSSSSNRHILGDTEGAPSADLDGCFHEVQRGT